MESNDLHTALAAAHRDLAAALRRAGRAAPAAVGTDLGVAADHAERVAVLHERHAAAIVAAVEPDPQPDPVVDPDQVDWYIRPNGNVGRYVGARISAAWGPNDLPPDPDLARLVAAARSLAATANAERKAAGQPAVAWAYTQGTVARAAARAAVAGAAARGAARRRGGADLRPVEPADVQPGADEPPDGRADGVGYRIR